MSNPGQNVTIEQALSLARGRRLQGKMGEAEGILRQVALVAPMRVDVLNELAMVLGDQGKLDETERCLKRAVELSPGFLPAWHNLAVAAERRGRYGEAVGYLARGVEIAPADAETRFRLAQTLKCVGELPEAMRQCRVAIELDPKHVEARGVYAQFLLLNGDFLRGWEEYEARWRCPSFPEERREWSDLRLGRDEIRGKRIAVHGEQGYGDMIQFSRYVRLLVDRGAEVTVVTPEDVRRVIAWGAGPAKVVSTKQKIEADYTVPMMSLPRVFGTTLETIPAEVPYISPPTELVEKWKKRLEGYGGIRVGIAWAGRPEHKQDRERSMRLAQLAPLAKIEGITLVMLQKGPASAEANPAPAGMKIVNLTAGIADFADTAGLIANLDLVISVDTAVVHLAGAMGKRVWTLLAAVPDFRWMLEREDSPWYPTMRLFRQRSVGGWDEVIDRVVGELRKE